MATLFKDEFLNELGCWPLAYIPYGGADVGEVEAVADAVGDGGDDAFYDAFIAAGARMAAEAETCLSKGHRQSARELYLRASVFFGASYHPLYGKPVDPRLLAGFGRQIEAMDKGLALFDPPILPQRIPFRGAAMPAYLIPAVGQEREVRPTIIFTNGYDATVTDLYFMSAVAASRRGYHALIVDGPGQGDMLYRQGVAHTPEWDAVISAVVDFALTQPIVDPKRIALNGASLGGYLAPRAAAGEPRLAACIADPGQWATGDSFRGVARKLGATEQQAANLGTIDDAVLGKLDGMIAQNRRLRWSIYQRGFWVLGCDTLRDFLVKTETYTMVGHAEKITCPTLITSADKDALAIGARTLFDALRCPKTMLAFTAAEGAGTHCEMTNRSLLNRRVLDWLDEVFA
ncbi:alpha/beta fold hydrolase [Roseomonas terrae]|uniref:Alpha/beta fold hydrolase n=1 Tax=Neoroseomonas terrae TaxID=424799 RepID=A0ABS5EF56_9PROT|nr:alpha/beta fold hydrolase [Neoroseomonas terrae]MBR0649656.1 alpha/beta fold hydrolase [Neoroseomonas terrae]